jgi:hypothetical protein
MVKKIGLLFDFVVMEAGILPFGDGRFDGVMANQMLCHVRDVEQTGFQRIPDYLSAENKGRGSRLIIFLSED